jgi:hypothetical protein
MSTVPTAMAMTTLMLSLILMVRRISFTLIGLG